MEKSFYPYLLFFVHSVSKLWTQWMLCISALARIVSQVLPNTQKNDGFINVAACEHLKHSVLSRESTPVRAKSGSAWRRILSVQRPKAHLLKSMQATRSAFCSCTACQCLKQCNYKFKWQQNEPIIWHVRQNRWMAWNHAKPNLLYVGWVFRTLSALVLFSHPLVDVYGFNYRGTWFWRNAVL